MSDKSSGPLLWSKAGVVHPEPSVRLVGWRALEAPHKSLLVNRISFIFAAPIAALRCGAKQCVGNSAANVEIFDDCIPGGAGRLIDLLGTALTHSQ